MKSRDVDRIARSLISHAARKAPSDLSERLEEEWLADLAAQNGGLARLRFAIGCCWATRVIAHEYLAPGIATAGAAAGSRSATTFTPSHPLLLSSRTAAFLVIAGLHAILIYAVASAYKHGMIKPAQPAPIGIVLAPPRTPQLDPQVRRAQMLRTSGELKLQDEPPNFNFVTDDDIRSDLPQVSQTESLPTDPEILNVHRVLGGPGHGFPNTDDYYPQESRRLGENGVATVEVCVNEYGRLTATPTLARSSGSAALDDGALKLAKAGSGHYRSTTEDGRPVNYCYPFRIRFQLN